ncbi:MAG: oxygen-dependent coproporphyrinogen oxidase [Cardiobacteriaceae bacterium]|nr:oxygen-dependent coproporphyrinogen oxidase [Cardiobacteriaceae bacterium]
MNKKFFISSINDTDIESFEKFLYELQIRITDALSGEDNQVFQHDAWQRDATDECLGGHGLTMILKNGMVIEQGGVNVSVIHGKKLPSSVIGRRPELANCEFNALGLSLVIHPRNPYVPTSHANIRLFVARENKQIVDWWFGGGFDLTPYYPFDDDCRFWHQVAYNACRPYAEWLYPKFKEWCDNYFYLPHRQETRGIGGLFFDHFNELPFNQARLFTQEVGDAYLKAYLPIVRMRKTIPYGERERSFQLYRRGRYIEFNLLYDRGTHFGLQSGGRTESILMSLPPLARFEYDYKIKAGTPEVRLATYLKPHNWLGDKFTEV